MADPTRNLSDAELRARIETRMRGARSPERIAEADEEGQARKAAGAPANDWVARYGFGAEDDIYGRGM